MEAIRSDAAATFAETKHDHLDGLDLLIDAQHKDKK
jgi:hypothetical protein